MLLDDIHDPADLRSLSPEQLDQLADEIRSFIVESVTTTGGHLGSNLGVVELTLALHRVFDSPRDVILWDTGHQAYIHKLVTGRRDDFPTLETGGRPVRVPVARRVRPRLGGEQPRLHRPQLRPRHRHRLPPPGRGRPSGGGRPRRRGPHRRHGLRSAQQPGPRRQSRRHRPERQRPVLRADRLQALVGPDPSPPESFVRPGPRAGPPPPAPDPRPGEPGLLGCPRPGHRRPGGRHPPPFLRGPGRPLRRTHRRPRRGRHGTGAGPHRRNGTVPSSSTS